MATKSNFTSEEWARFLASPMLAGMAITAVRASRSISRTVFVRTPNWSMGETFMSDDTNLKGNFDEALTAAKMSITKLTTRISVETSTPSVWSAEQLADLCEIAGAMRHLSDAVSEMARRVRDD